MARAIHRLTARQAETLSKPGRHADGGNLYLAITPNGGKRWTFLFRWKGKPREMGLGSAAKGQVPLAEARDRAAAARKLLNAGIDPLSAKNKRSGRAVPTFGQCADEYIKTHRSKYRNAEHARQWQSTLSDDYCSAIRSMPVDQVDTAAVLSVLTPLWGRIPETASRMRGRIEAVLSAAKANSYRSGENPARWRGHLDHLLPARQKLAKSHLAALPYDDLPAFIAALRTRQSLAALALELVILTACRTGEVIGATWSEFDLDKAVWTIPATRMKAGQEHRVPLCERAGEILKALPRFEHNPHIFPGNARGKPLSAEAMRALLRSMGFGGITVHGFRSTFRDWSAETTSFPRDVCERALAHTIESKVEAAYRRGDLFEKRRQLMSAWAQFCEPRAAGKLIPLMTGVKR